jgi:hypothetical protein
VYIVGVEYGALEDADHNDRQEREEDVVHRQGRILEQVLPVNRLKMQNQNWVITHRAFL